MKTADIGKECTNKYCIKQTKSISDILGRDFESWGQPAIFEISSIKKSKVFPVRHNAKYHYFNEILDSKTRNMIRKADRHGIKCKAINKNDYLKEVHDINTSSLFRQGRIMSEGYRKFPKHTEYVKECDKHFWEFYGAFIGDKLIAYISVLSHKEAVLISQILGHMDYLKTAVMNKLLMEVIGEICKYKYAKYIQYGFWFSGGAGLRHFKQSMGFVPLNLIEGGSYEFRTEA